MMNLKLSEQKAVFELLSNDERVSMLLECARKHNYSSDIEWFEKALKSVDLSDNQLDELIEYGMDDVSVIYALDNLVERNNIRVNELVWNKLMKSTTTLDERLGRYIEPNMIEYCRSRGKMYVLPLSIKQENKSAVIDDIKNTTEDYYYRYEDFCVENDIMKEWFKPYSFLDDMPLDDVLEDMEYIYDIDELREYIAQMLPNDGNGTSLAELYRWIDTSAEIYIVDNLVDEWLDAHSEYADCEYLDYDKIENDMLCDYNECITMYGYIMIM